MNARVRVWNEGPAELVEEFKDRVVRIPVGKFIEMPRAEAVHFKGQFRPVQLNGMNEPTPMSFKKIRIEGLYGGKLEPVKESVCMADGRDVGSKEALEEYIDSTHLDKLEDQELAEKRVQKRRGRPPKVQTE